MPLHLGRYPVRQAAAHPIFENFRVEAFRAILEGRPTATPALLSLGELMFQSHASYRWLRWKHACCMPAAALLLCMLADAAVFVLSPLMARQCWPCSRCGLGSRGTDLLVGELL